jgi:hypothetical protein
VTTLCLCDWVETRVDRERRLALNATAPPGDNRNTTVAADKAALLIASRPMARRDAPLQPEYIPC